jgi:hypothetical protein
MDQELKQYLDAKFAELRARLPYPTPPFDELRARTRALANALDDGHHERSQSILDSWKKIIDSGALTVREGISSGTPPVMAGSPYFNSTIVAPDPPSSADAT